MVVVSKLGSVQEVLPVVLSVIAEHVKVHFKPFVVAFNLPLGLGVVCSGKVLVDAEASVKGLHVWVIELQSPVCIVT